MLSLIILLLSNSVISSDATLNPAAASVRKFNYPFHIVAKSPLLICIAPVLGVALVVLAYFNYDYCVAHSTAIICSLLGIFFCKNIRRVSFQCKNFLVFCYHLSVINYILGSLLFIVASSCWYWLYYYTVDVDLSNVASWPPLGVPYVVDNYDIVFFAIFLGIWLFYLWGRGVEFLAMLYSEAAGRSPTDLGYGSIHARKVGVWLQLVIYSVLSFVMFYLVIRRLDSTILENIYSFYGNAFLFLLVAFVLVVIGLGLINVLSRLFMHPADRKSDSDEAPWNAKYLLHLVVGIAAVALALYMMDSLGISESHAMHRIKNITPEHIAQRELLHKFYAKHLNIWKFCKSSTTFGSGGTYLCQDVHYKMFLLLDDTGFMEYAKMYHPGIVKELKAHVFTHRHTNAAFNAIFRTNLNRVIEEAGAQNAAQHIVGGPKFNLLVPVTNEKIPGGPDVVSLKYTYQWWQFKGHGLIPHHEQNLNQLGCAVLADVRNSSELTTDLLELVPQGTRAILEGQDLSSRIRNPNKWGLNIFYREHGALSRSINGQFCADLNSSVDTYLKCLYVDYQTGYTIPVAEEARNQVSADVTKIYKQNPDQFVKGAGNKDQSQLLTYKDGSTERKKPS